MVESTIDKIKDITVERQIRKLAGIIDEQNKKIAESVDYSTDIDNLKTSDANQNTEINKLKTTSATHTTDIDNLKVSDANQNTEINNLKQTVEPAITDINNLKESDANQTTQINNLKQSVATDKLATESAITALQNKDAEQDGTLTNHATLIQGITESLVSAVQIMSGTTTGDIKVRLERESAAAIDSNDYNLGLPVSAEIIQGTGPSMFKIQITMSTGVKVVSNDFVFTTEAIGNDVYISSFTFKAGNQTGYLSADIGLNNGMTIEANNFLVPTDPNVTSAIADLQTRLTTVENTGVTDINGLKTTVSEHTSEINTLKSDVAGLTTDKADVNNNEQTITAGTINATNINKNGVAVATVNDIPVAPDISSKADLNNSSQSIVAGSISATNIIKDGVNVATVNDISSKADLKNTKQNFTANSILATNINAVIIRKGNIAVATVDDIPDISGKVDKAQGANNAGKVLGIGSDGNVTPVAVSSGGENWEEINVSSLPTDFKSGDILRIMLYELGTTATLENTSGSWNNSTLIDNGGVKVDKGWSSQIIEIEIPSSGANAAIVGCGDQGFLRPSYAYRTSCKVNNYNNWNSTNPISIQCLTFSGNDAVLNTVDVSRANLSNYVKKMWRLKK